jgi:hypothetical protein
MELDPKKAKLAEKLARAAKEYLAQSSEAASFVMVTRSVADAPSEQGGRRQTWQVVCTS